MLRTSLRILLLLFSPLVSFAEVSNNVELEKMYKDDQSSRSTSNIDWQKLEKEDSERKTRVYQLISQGKLITGKDYYHSAMIFQHGGDSTSYGMAVKLMRTATTLDTTISKWLLAAAIDRELMSKKKPQIYGTQYLKKVGSNVWERYTIDSAKISDEERKAYGVETLAQQVVRLRKMNQNNQ